MFLIDLCCYNIAGNSAPVWHVWVDSRISAALDYIDGAMQKKRNTSALTIDMIIMMMYILNQSVTQALLILHQWTLTERNLI